MRGRSADETSPQAVTLAKNGKRRASHAVAALK